MACGEAAGLWRDVAPGVLPAPQVLDRTQQLFERGRYADEQELVAAITAQRRAAVGAS
jgi:hypothetical protein